MVNVVQKGARPPTGPATIGGGPRAAAARDKLADAVLTHLLDGGSPGESLRALAAGVGVSHSLLLYHFGSTAGLLAEVHAACERRERKHLAALRITGRQPVSVMRAMWQHLAQPRMWPIYRLGFALRLRDDVPTPGQDREREAWVSALEPLVAAFDLDPVRARDESLLWVATCRGLLWELVTGADPKRVHHAAERFFTHYQPPRPRSRPVGKSS